MKDRKKIRYGIVGLGHISQTAVLPAFQNASQNSVLTALVSGDLKKQRKIAKRYQIEHCYTYDNYEELLEADVVDALYIALPNHLHFEFAKRALKKGLHVLCEKPLANRSEDCEELIEAAAKAKAQLMTAYRLHFDPANLKAIQLIRAGKIGDPRYFNSSFSFIIQDPNNIRLRNETGGGVLWDIGVYCVNAARYLFQAEPVEVMAMTGASRNPKFQEVEETAGVVMKFPNDRIANFAVSFGAEAISEFQMFGTKGTLRLENAYDYLKPRTLKLSATRSRKTFHFGVEDQFAPELIYFSKCILNGTSVEPSGVEGLADVRIIEALYESAATGKAIRVHPDQKLRKRKSLTMRQSYREPAVPEVPTVGVRSPS